MQTYGRVLNRVIAVSCVAALAGGSADAQAESLHIFNQTAGQRYLYKHSGIDCKADKPAVTLNLVRIASGRNERKTKIAGTLSLTHTGTNGKRFVFKYKPKNGYRLCLAYGNLTGDRYVFPSFKGNRFVEQNGESEDSVIILTVFAQRLS